MRIVSVFYSAKRDYPLTESERMAIGFVIDQYSVKERMEQRKLAQQGAIWEDFYLYEPPLSTPDTILEGATALPRDSGEEAGIALHHWCNALTEIRHAIANGKWSVSVNDQIIHWNHGLQRYDPAK